MQTKQSALGRATRDPKPAPFPVGTRLRYIGGREVWVSDPGTGQPVVALVRPGLEVVVDGTMNGWRGTGRILRGEGGMLLDDYTGDPILDETEDAVSIYHVVDPSGKHHGRLIRDEGKQEWEVVSEPDWEDRYCVNCGHKDRRTTEGEEHCYSCNRKAGNGEYVDTRERRVR